MKQLVVNSIIALLLLIGTTGLVGGICMADARPHARDHDFLTDDVGFEFVDYQMRLNQRARPSIPNIGVTQERYDEAVGTGEEETLLRVIRHVNLRGAEYHRYRSPEAGDVT